MGAVGKSAPMDGGYLPHGTNTPAVGSRIQEYFIRMGCLKVKGTCAAEKEGCCHLLAPLLRTQPFRPSSRTSIANAKGRMKSHTSHPMGAQPKMRFPQGV